MNIDKPQISAIIEYSDDKGNKYVRFVYEKHVRVFATREDTEYILKNAGTKKSEILIPTDDPEYQDILKLKPVKAKYTHKERDPNTWLYSTRTLRDYFQKDLEIIEEFKKKYLPELTGVNV